jgi:hypothetical protein
MSLICRETQEKETGKRVVSPNHIAFHGAVPENWARLCFGRRRADAKLRDTGDTIVHRRGEPTKQSPWAAGNRKGPAGDRCVALPKRCAPTLSSACAWRSPPKDSCARSHLILGPAHGVKFCIKWFIARFPSRQSNVAWMTGEVPVMASLSMQAMIGISLKASPKLLLVLLIRYLQ